MSFMCPKIGAQKLSKALKNRVMSSLTSNLCEFDEFPSRRAKPGVEEGWDNCANNPEGLRCPASCSDSSAILSGNYSSARSRLEKWTSADRARPVPRVFNGFVLNRRSLMLMSFRKAGITFSAADSSLKVLSVPMTIRRCFLVCPERASLAVLPNVGSLTTRRAEERKSE
jgi:hypothetical protein